MTTFGAVNHLYDLFETCSLTYHGVQHEEFHNYWLGVTSISRTLNQLSDDVEVRDFLRPLRRYRFEMTAAPLSFNRSLLVTTDHVSQVRRFTHLARTAYPDLADSIEHISGLFHQLRRCEDTPLLNEIEKLLSHTEGVPAGVLVADGRFIQPTREMLSSRLEMEKMVTIEVLTPSQVRAARCYDQLLVMGPPRPTWFPDYVFNAPRATRVHVLTYQWNLNKWDPRPSFLGACGELGIHSSPLPSRTVDWSRDEIDRELDWEEIERRWIQWGNGDANTEDDDGDVIAARLYLLDGGFAAFLEATGRRATLTIDLETDASSRVKQLADRDIEVDMFVVLRTDSDHGYIIPIADRILGDHAARYRESQRLWKIRLREKVREHDALTVAINLIDLGSDRADETNIRNWMSENTIAPANRVDFDAIMRLTGLTSQGDDIWKMANRIRNAHVRAGIQVQKKLRDMVRSVDSDELERRGQLEFELAEVPGGKLTAFRVEERSNRIVNLPSSRVETVFRHEG